MSTLQQSPLGLSNADRDAYWRDGFVIVRGLFGPEEARLLQVETDRLLAECKELIHPRNLRCRFMAHHRTGEQQFEVFDPVNDLSPLCEKICHDPRMLGVMESLYGEPACLFKEKLIFKLPGSNGYPLHQDIPLAWGADFPQTFLTAMLAIDETSIENGCTELFRGYHHGFLSTNPAEYMLPDEVVDLTRKTDLVMRPGDLAIFHGLTPHRSVPNRSTKMRRAFYISYNALSDGGDRRARHYRQFQEQMRKRLQSQSSEPVFFR